MIDELNDIYIIKIKCKQKISCVVAIGAMIASQVSANQPLQTNHDQELIEMDQSLSEINTGMESMVDATDINGGARSLLANKRKSKKRSSRKKAVKKAKEFFY